VRICTFEQGGESYTGVVAADDTIVRTEDLVAGAIEEDEMLDLLLSGERFWKELSTAAREARGGIPLQSARLLAPIPRPPRNVFCVGWN
jgi:hypothetical protein